MHFAPFERTSTDQVRGHVSNHFKHVRLLLPRERCLNRRICLLKRKRKASMTNTRKSWMHIQRFPRLTLIISRLAKQLLRQRLLSTSLFFRSISCICTAQLSVLSGVSCDFLYVSFDNKFSSLHPVTQTGPKGQKGKLNGSNRLQVLNKETEDRMMVLVRDFTRNTLQSADYDEFRWLHGLFQASLHKMALDAKGTVYSFSPK